MSAELQTAAGIEAEIRLSGSTAVRNFFIDYLAKRCKWCGADVEDSPTKHRQFCDNNNVCCNAYSRAKKRGKAKRSSLAVCQSRANRWLQIWEWGKAGSTVDNIRVSRDEVIRASGQTVECILTFVDDNTRSKGFTFDRARKEKLTLDRIVERRKEIQLVKDHGQKFSRCMQCGTEFTDQGRPVVSAFAFCGETQLVAGSCKKAWLVAHPETCKPSDPVPEPTPMVTGWERGEVEHKSRAGIRRIERKKDQPAFAVK